MVIQLRHRPDGRARGSYRIRLVYGDRRRNTLDPIDCRFVHAVEELTRIRGECFDITPLPFGIEGVEYQRGLPGSRYARDDDELARRYLDIEIF